MTLSDLLASARARVDRGSRRALALHLGMHPESLRQYEVGRSLPTEETIVRLCALTGLSVEEGLLNLCVWRTEGTARAVYSRMLAAWIEQHGTERARVRARR